MNKAATAESSEGSQVLFWGCFVALITTAFAFVGRLSLMNVWSQEFGLDPAQAGRLGGIGIWPFAVSIILFSLFIDQIGYKTAMFCAFGGHLIWSVMGVAAYFVSQGGDTKTAYQLLYWGSFVCALANGTVEAFINPVVATMFSREKTKWLNILHAGWPGGLVLTGLVIILIDTFAKSTPWAVKVGLIAVPTVAYMIMLIGQKFPESERVSAGVSYKEMLAEFGFAGAAIVAFLIALQLIDFFGFDGTNKTIVYVAAAALAIGFGVYTQSAGNLFLLFMIIIMMPLATTEIGTDGWIGAIMEGVAEKAHFHPGWILVYTSAIMLVLRFFAGPIVHALSPLGMLVGSAVLAIAGLMLLGNTTGAAAIFAVATLYGIGKTFFWPTMLGVVSEQCPKGGALTLNAISGIGMLAVGTLGFPYIGVLQTQVQQKAIAESSEVAQKIPGLVEGGKLSAVTPKVILEVFKYNAIDDDKVKSLVAGLPADDQKPAQQAFDDVRSRSNQRALKDMAMFPAFMLVCYLILVGYFQSKGGYKPVELAGGGGGH